MNRHTEEKNLTSRIKAITGGLLLVSFLASPMIASAANPQERDRDRDRATQDQRQEESVQHEDAKQVEGLVVDLHHYLRHDDRKLGKHTDAEVAGQNSGGPVALLVENEGLIMTRTELQVIVFDTGSAFAPMRGMRDVSKLETGDVSMEEPHHQADAQTDSPSARGRQAGERTSGTADRDMRHQTEQEAQTKSYGQSAESETASRDRADDAGIDQAYDRAAQAGRRFGEQAHQIVEQATNLVGQRVRVTGIELDRDGIKAIAVSQIQQIGAPEDRDLDDLDRELGQ